MYDMNKLIKEGRDIMQHNSKKNISAFEMRKVKDISEDEYQFAENMFFIGVALGSRIDQETKSAVTDGARNR